jgi:Meiotically up-regulated gene 113
MAVYFIRAGTGHVKIGYSRDPKGRLRGLQSAQSTAMVLLRTIDGDQGVERWLHRQFGAYRIRGEWFTFHPDMLTVTVPDPLPLLSPEIQTFIPDPLNGASLDTAAFKEWLYAQVLKFPTRLSFARSVGLSPAYLSDVLNGHREPSARFLARLGLRRVRMYLVPDDEDDNSAEDATTSE